MRLSLHPADHQTQHKSQFTFATQGNQGSRKTPRRSFLTRSLIADHCTPEKYRMECVGKTCCAATESAVCRKSVSSLSLPGCRFLGAGEGNRTPDPLITNQMLYRLSYASKFGRRHAFAQTDPSDPCQMSGTII